MFISAAASKAVTILKVLAVSLLCAGVLICSSDCARGVAAGTGFCLKVLVPSLFPFMALSSFIVNSGLANTLGRPFGKFTRAVFGLSHTFAPIILLSMTGGYPVGAKTISTLYKNGLASKEECERAAMFAVCAGPGFLVNFVGISLYGSRIIGFILLFSQMLSVVLIGIFLRAVCKSKIVDTTSKKIYQKPMPLSNAIVQSVIDSSKCMLAICAFVVLFSAFTELLSSFIYDDFTKDFLLVILEVCSAVNRLSSDKPLELIAFATGFGGICVHFQIFSALGELKINKLSFFCIRIIQGVITALLTHIGMLFFCGKQQVFSTAEVQSADFFGGTVVSGAALLGIALCFLYTIKNYKQN